MPARAWDDNLAVMREDLATLRRQYDQAGTAELDHRLADPVRWANAQKRRKARIRVFEREIAEFVALEESRAELDEDYRQGDAA